MTQAPRGTRFVARFIDGILTLVAAAPGFIMIALNVGDRPNDGNVIGAVGLLLLLVFGFLVYQWMGIAKNGQTLGKRWMGIRVVKQDGRRSTSSRA